MNIVRPLTCLPELFTKGLYQFTLPLTKDERTSIKMFQGSTFQSSYKSLAKAGLCLSYGHSHLRINKYTFSIAMKTRHAQTAKQPQTNFD